MKQPKQCDYLVIGAGSGGLLAAVGLQQLGKDVLVVSKDIGGDCTHYGCVPSKNFLQLASDYTRESDESAKAELKRTALQNVQALVHAFSEEESTLIASDRYLNGVA